MTNQVTFRFSGDAKPLQTSAKQAHQALTSITKTALPAGSAISGIGSSLTQAFSPANLASGPLAAAAAIGAVATIAKETVDVLLNASKAYFEDAKSVEKLDLALINNTKATDDQIHGIEKQIDSLSMLAAVQDDVLRSSYANIVAATKDSTASMRLLRIATDVSAGSGLGLEKVSKALTKAYMGNSSALQKMLPGVHAGKQGINDLADAYKGAASAVGDASPFERIKLAGENIQEALGTILAPLIEQFATWLTSEDFQTFLDSFIGFCKGVAAGIYSVLQPVIDTINVVTSPQFLGVLGAWAKQNPEKAGKAFTGMFGAMNSSKAPSWLTDVNAGLDKLRDKAGKIKGMKFKIGDAAEKAPEVAQRLKDAAKSIQESGKKFAQALNFSEYLNKDSGVFDASAFMEKFRGIVAAAKALPAKLKALRAAGASPEVLQQIVAMGPEQGLAVAQGFLSQSGSAAEYSKSLSTLNTLGQQSAAVGMTQQNTYEINVNKANMTAEEIIAAIQKYERKTGKKVNLVNG